MDDSEKDDDQQSLPEPEPERDTDIPDTVYIRDHKEPEWGTDSQIINESKE